MKRLIDEKIKVVEGDYTYNEEDNVGVITFENTGDVDITKEIIFDFGKYSIVFNEVINKIVNSPSVYLNNEKYDDKESKTIDTFIINSYAYNEKNQIDILQPWSYNNQKIKVYYHYNKTNNCRHEF